MRWGLVLCAALVGCTRVAQESRSSSAAASEGSIDVLDATSGSVVDPAEPGNYVDDVGASRLQGSGRAGLPSAKSWASLHRPSPPALDASPPLSWQDPGAPTAPRYGGVLDPMLGDGPFDWQGAPNDGVYREAPGVHQWIPIPTGAPFDRAATAVALGSVSVGACKTPGGPAGPGHIRITFAPSGDVQSAVLDRPPFTGTVVGGCIVAKFRSVHIPSFAGGAVTVGKAFELD